MPEEKEHDNEDIYEKETVEEELENDEISNAEAGMMEGVDKELDREGQKKKDEVKD